MNDGQDYRPRDWSGQPVDRPLVDDLANVLAGTVVGWSDRRLHETPEVRRVMARYRQSQSRRAPVIPSKPMRGGKT